MMAMTERQRSRLAKLESNAPMAPLPYDLHCLTDAELIVLASVPTNADGESIVPPQLADEVARIMAKAEACCHG